MYFFWLGATECSLKGNRLPGSYPLWSRSPFDKTVVSWKTQKDERDQDGFCFGEAHWERSFICMHRVNKKDAYVYCLFPHGTCGLRGLLKALTSFTLCGWTGSGHWTVIIQITKKRKYLKDFVNRFGSGRNVREHFHFIFSPSEKIRGLFSILSAWRIKNRSNSNKNLV